MHLKIIACKVLQRELSSVSWRSPHSLDITTLRQQFHNVPKNLHQQLQDEIDRIEGGDDCYSNDAGPFDAIVLGYGLCSNAVLGLHSSKYPLVIPRIHDCISILLGSKERYQQVFQTYPGSFFMSKGWLEVGETQSEALLKQRYLEYMEKYEDEEIVQELMELEEEMVSNYKNSIFIRWPGLEDSQAREQVKQDAEKRNWNYLELEGSGQLLTKLVEGDWDEDAFLIVQPGQTICQDPLGKIMVAK